MSFHYRHKPALNICVRTDTFIETAYGPRRLDSIDNSILVHTREHGLIMPRSVYRFRLSCLRSLFFPQLTPVKIPRGALNGISPIQDTWVLPSQLIWDGTSTVPASHASTGARKIGENVTYTLLQFLEPTAVFINGLIFVATELPTHQKTAIGLLEKDWAMTSEKIAV